MRGMITLIAIYGLVALLLLSGCADGRWVVHDLSHVSFEFSGPTSVATPARSPSAATR